MMKIKIFQIIARVKRQKLEKQETPEYSGQYFANYQKKINFKPRENADEIKTFLDK